LEHIKNNRFLSSAGTKPRGWPFPTGDNDGDPYGTRFDSLDARHTDSDPAADEGSRLAELTFDFGSALAAAWH
jgi:hypothetical protein